MEHSDQDANEMVTAGKETARTYFDTTDRELITQVWDERAAQMAKVEAASENLGEQITILLFRLGREVMGIDVQNIVNIRPCQSITRVPRVPGWIAGITNLRGNILPVVNLWKFFGLPGETSSQEMEKSGLLVIVSTQAGNSHSSNGRHSDSIEMIFLVEDVLGVETLMIRKRAVDSGLIHRLKAEYVRAIAERKISGAGEDEIQSQRHIAVLDVEVLLEDPRFMIHDEVV